MNTLPQIKSDNSEPIISKSANAIPTIEPNQNPPQPKTDAAPVSIVYNLNDRFGLFGIIQPDGFVAAAFGSDSLHLCRLTGDWDLERAVSENANALCRSIQIVNPDGKTKKWDDLTFQFGARSFLYADATRIKAFASTPEEAEQLVKEFSEKYRRPTPPSGGVFHLITTGVGVETKAVCLEPETMLNDLKFDLHYPDATFEWHRHFVEKLRTTNHGLSIFEGMPGTGKTSYLRHLMDVLKETHRFYFIPTACMSILSSPAFIKFWAEERRSHSGEKFVVILEDSDAPLMTRGSDNREQVSAILNLTDGMLGDFLQLQIICTINCAAADIDPALLRPGRLHTHHIFDKLDYVRASRLAESLDHELPSIRDYSLAEVYAESEVKEILRPRIGFAG